jgi:transmembrane sensor
MVFDLIRSRRSAQIERDAARWIAHLHSDRCTDSDRRRFADWLARSSDHAACFEEASEAWGDLQYMPAMPREATQRTERVGGIHRRRLLGALGVTAAVGGGAFAWTAAAARTYETGLGERRRIEVEPGVRLDLDALSRARVSAGGGSITIEEGRARVAIRDRRTDIRAGACSFATGSAVLDIECSRDGFRHLAVLKGNGTLRKSGEDRTQSISAPSLVRGPEMRLSSLDAAELERLTAWQDGRVIFNDETLQDAIMVMNRYDRGALRLQGSGVADLRVSGMFKLGDNGRFVEALTVLLPVSARREGAIWVLTRS